MISTVGSAVFESPRRAIDPVPAAIPTNAVEIDFTDSPDPSSLRRAAAARRFELVGVRAVAPLTAGADHPGRAYCERLKSFAWRCSARTISSRLSMTAPAHGIARKGASAAKQTEAQARRTVESLMQHFGPVHFYLDHAPPAGGSGARNGEARILSRVLKGTGCGWLIDVARLYVEAQNGGSSAYDLIEEVLPAASRVQMRLAGVRRDSDTGRYVESVGDPIPDAMFELYEFVLEVAYRRVDSVFVRRDPAHRNSVRSVRTAREIAAGVCAIA